MIGRDDCANAKSDGDEVGRRSRTTGTSRTTHYFLLLVNLLLSWCIICRTPTCHAASAPSGGANNEGWSGQGAGYYQDGRDRRGYGSGGYADPPSSSPAGRPRSAPPDGRGLPPNVDEEEEDDEESSSKRYQQEDSRRDLYPESYQYSSSYADDAAKAMYPRGDQNDLSSRQTYSAQTQRDYYEQTRDQSQTGGRPYPASATSGQVGYDNQSRDVQEDPGRGPDRGGVAQGVAFEGRRQQQQSTFSPRQPPPKQQQNRRPIHYQFPATQSVARDDASDTPGVGDENDDQEQRGQMQRDEDEAGGGRERRRPRPGETTDFASPRRDVITTFISTKKGRAKVTASASTIGMAIGAFLGKSTMNNPTPLAVAGCVLFLAMSFTRGDFGELVRALGLALIFALQRTRRIRRSYPTRPHLKALVRSGPRRAFPPISGRPGDDDYNDNPWAYRPVYVDDVEFRMARSLLAMAFVGTVCGGNLPLVPTWMGAVMGAASFAYVTTLRDSKGDLARTMGMKVVAFVEEFMSINSDLSVFSKLQVVGGKLLDKVLILDRKHSIRDKIGASMKWIYGRVSKAASQVQADMQDRGGGEGGGSEER